MSKRPAKTLFSFYAKKPYAIEISSPSLPLNSEANSSNLVDRPAKIQKSEDSIKHDPGLRQPIWMYHFKEQDAIRRRYIVMGPCQPDLKEKFKKK